MSWRTNMSFWSYTGFRYRPSSTGRCRRPTGGFTSGVSTRYARRPRIRIVVTGLL